jgi:hypothetical protein
MVLNYLSLVFKKRKRSEIQVTDAIIMIRNS